MALITLAMMLVVLAVTVLSCVSDVRSLRIPNALALAAALSFFPAWLSMPEAFAPVWQHVAAAVFMFGITYMMFVKGMMGGGDSKLGSALALWVGLRGLLPLVFYMALVGGVLGVMSLALQKWKPFKTPQPGGWIEQAQAQGNAIPYGVAISFGTWASFFHTHLFHHILDEVLKIIH